MNFRIPVWPLAVLFTVVSGIGFGADAPPLPGLKSDSALAGQIWIPAERRFASPDEVVERALAASVVGLGEVHDNADHHALQAWVVRRLAAAGRRPVVVFEMIDEDQQDLVSQDPAQVEGVGAAVTWEKRGWPSWALYRPIAQAALDAGGRLVAGNLPVAVARNIARGHDVSGIGARYGLDDKGPDHEIAAMAEEIRQAHCGLLPQEAVTPMVNAQRARDAALAQAVAEAAGRPGFGPAVLVAGSGHVRTDRGATARLSRLLPNVKIFAIGFKEASGDDLGDAALAAALESERSPFDAVWFTGPAPREDPCGQMADFMTRKKAKAANPPPSGAP